MATSKNKKGENTDSEMHKRIQKFLYDVYLGEIELAKFKGQKFLHIDYKKIIKFDIELAEFIKENFEQTISIFNTILADMLDTNNMDDVKVRFDNMVSIDKDIWKLRVADMNKPVVVTGFARRVGEVMHQVVKEIRVCPACGNQIIVLMDGDESTAPTKCSCGRKGKFDLMERIMKDTQKFIIEEDSAKLNPMQKPRSILISVADDLTRFSIDSILQPSKKTTILGLLRDKPVKKGQNEFKKYIEANNIYVYDESNETKNFTKDEIAEFKRVSETKTLYEDMIRSIFPNIKGYDEAKTAIFLQLLGGVPKYLNGVLEERDQIHVLLISSPGTGKTQLLKRAIQFLPGSRFSAGKGVSGVGLIASVSKDEELGFTMDAGVIPMASGYMCALDEIDKIDPEDLAYLNNAMVDMAVSIDKANIHSRLNTRTAILASANPKNRVFDKHELVWKQIGLPKDVLDRFDIVFPMEMTKSEEDKRDVANLIVGKYREDSKVLDTPYTKEFVIKYISYARMLQPKLNEEVQSYLIENFLNIMKPKDRQEDSAYFSYRILTNIVRLTQAVAKARLSDDINKEDAKRAIKLLITSLRLQNIITEDGLYNYEIAEGIVPKAKRDVMIVVKQIMMDLQNKSKEKTFNFFELITCIKTTLGMTEDKIEEILSLMRTNGDIMEIAGGIYKLTEL